MKQIIETAKYTKYTKMVSWFSCISCISRFMMTLPAGATVLTEQTLTLKKGWNAVYAEVAPTGTLASVFAAWPVESVGIYDPGALLSTQQFSAESETEGAVATPFAMWYRDYPDASDAERITAGSVMLLFNTNAATKVVLRGVPAAPRLKWHVSGANDVNNYVGFSLQPGASINPSEYLDGFGGVYYPNRSFFRITGTSKDASPKMTTIFGTPSVADGDVLVMRSDIVSDFSGPLYVSPVNGLDFGEETVQRTLTIRNDGARPRTVKVTLSDPANAQDVVLQSAWLHWRDAAVALTNAAWQTGFDIAPKTLAAGEEWRLQFGLDRKALANFAEGLSFGMVLAVEDADGGSRMRVKVPLTGTTSGGYATARAWPGGLWVGDVALNAVKGPNDKSATATGGTLKLRLPLHIDANGTIRLLQRVVSAGSVEPDGTYDYHLYAGAATPSATENVTMRISAVCLPTETPVVVAESAGLATGQATFRFTVAGDGATSLLRHPYHPQHDGLRWDFTTAAPSGDVFDNYKFDVKPETFSVASEITVRLDFNGGEAAWNPENEVAGMCEWSLSGLRHEGAVTVSGPMTLRRISPKTEIILKTE